MTVPALRFPEFKDDPNWEQLLLNGIAVPIKDKGNSHDEQNFLTLSGEFGLVNQGEYFGKKIAGESADRYVRIKLNDFAYNDRTTKLFNYGAIKRLSNHQAGLVSPIYKCFRLKNGQSPIFWEWYFESGAHEGELKKLINEGARAGRYNISIDSFLSIPVWSPPPREQNRIVDCLTSLDDLITVQAQKIETLKAHKKGLMQQLFPAESEAVPSLRFPEFRKGGKWISSTLGEISRITSGGTPSRSEPDFWNGDIPWITTSLIDSNLINHADEYITELGLKESSAKVFPKNTILMAMYGQGKTRGKVAMLRIEAATNQACAAIFLNKKINTEFVFQNLAARYDEIRKMSNPGGQENLSAGLIEKIQIQYTKIEEEQQRIANCLSSIDDHITAQTQKLEALKTHKKGLMQGLFPTLDGAAA